MDRGRRHRRASLSKDGSDQGLAFRTTGPRRASVGAQQNAPAGEWRVYGSDLRSTKYSPLTQITADNFSTLKIAWRWKSADMFLSRTIPGRGEVWASSRVIFEQLNKENPTRWRDGQPPLLNN